MKSILITGGEGLLGSNVTRFFIERGYDVFTVDTKGKNLPNHIVCDLSKKENLKLLPDKIDYVLHFAAHIDENVGDDKEFLLRNNALSTFNILEYSFEKNVKKFIYSSSITVYGKSKEYPIKENFESKPDSMYGFSKHVGEELCDLYSRKGMKIISFRVGYILAPSIPERYFIHRIMEKIRKNEPVKIVNGDVNSMSFVDVEDIAGYCEEGLESDLTGIFNLAGEREVKSREVMNILINSFENYSGDVAEENSGNIMKNHFSCEKLYSSFKKRYSVPLEESIKRITSNFISLHKE
ncbi:MAG: NAD(P)-dependent oxidoreductase [Nanoarchaeota archaeon]|nr:NAD(P)-dependent oxidoreductase [Nanoarchaeota archaeon]